MTLVRESLKLPAVFIVSSGRSGTTLLASMLNASDQIYIPYESDFIARAYPHYKDKQSFSEDDYKHISKIFKLAAKQDGWGMSEEYIVSRLKERSPQTFADVNAVIYEAFHQKEKTEDLLWGIKAPVLIASLDRIVRVCPQAKIVHIVRDGRDVYLSYKKVHETSEIKFGPKGIVENALYWIDGLRRVEDFLKTHSEKCIYELKYEDLLNNPETSLKQLCDFLEIDYTPSMHENFTSLERNSKVVPEYFKKNVHSNLKKGLDPKNTKKFLAAMPRIDLIEYELVAIPYLQKYDYQSEYPILSTAFLAPIRRLLYFFARQYNDLRYSKRDRKIYESSLSR